MIARIALSDPTAPISLALLVTSSKRHPSWAEPIRQWMTSPVHRSRFAQNGQWGQTGPS
jgi:hypothetical protein